MGAVVKNVQTDEDIDIGTSEYCMTETKYLENTLYNYFYLKQKELDIRNEIKQLDEKIKSEKVYLKGFSYETDTAVVGSGCSVSYKHSPELDELTNQLIDKTEQLKNIQRTHMQLDRTNSLNEKIKKLSIENQIIVYAIFRKGMVISEFAKIEGVSSQTIRNRLAKALEEMIRNG